MQESTDIQSRWVVQKVNEYTVRYARELAIRYRVPIAHVVDVAMYRLYADPKALEGMRPEDGWRRDG